MPEIKCEKGTLFIRGTVGKTGLIYEEPWDGPVHRNATCDQLKKTAEKYGCDLKEVAKGTCSSDGCVCTF